MAENSASANSQENPKLCAVDDVEIDSGKFKYILIKVHDKGKDGDFKYIVRGNSRGEYHADIYDEVAPKIEKSGLDCECVGGGRILNEPLKKSIHIYGYSQGFGRADHSITQAIIQSKYRDYTVTWSNDGY